VPEGYVECEYCGAANPVGARVCRRCRQSRPTGVAGLAARPRGAEQFSSWVGGIRPSQGEARRGGTSGLKVASIALALVIVVVVATVTLRAEGFLGAPTTPANSGTTRTDLCSSGPPSDCNGYQLVLPYVQEGREENVTPCISITPADPSSVQLRYTTSSWMYGVVIPSLIYWGTNVSFSEDPSGFFADPNAVVQAAWSSGFVTGANSIDVSLPSSTPQWCLAWWDPGSAGAVTFDSDLVLET
jgi:hypothetical protein